MTTFRTFSAHPRPVAPDNRVDARISTHLASRFSRVAQAPPTPRFAGRRPTRTELERVINITSHASARVRAAGTPACQSVARSASRPSRIARNQPSSRCPTSSPFSVRDTAGCRGRNASPRVFSSFGDVRWSADGAARARRSDAAQSIRAIHAARARKNARRPGRRPVARIRDVFVRAVCRGRAVGRAGATGDARRRVNSFAPFDGVFRSIDRSIESIDPCGLFVSIASIDRPFRFRSTSSPTQSIDAIDRLERLGRPLRFVSNASIDRLFRFRSTRSIDSIDRRNRSIDSNDSIATPRGRRPPSPGRAWSSVVSRASRVAGAPSTSTFVVRIARRGVRATLNSCAETNASHSWFAAVRRDATFSARARARKPCARNSSVASIARADARASPRPRNRRFDPAAPRAIARAIARAFGRRATRRRRAPRVQARAARDGATTRASSVGRSVGRCHQRLKVYATTTTTTPARQRLRYTKRPPRCVATVFWVYLCTDRRRRRCVRPPRHRAFVHMAFSHAQYEVCVFAVVRVSFHTRSALPTRHPSFCRMRSSHVQQSLIYPYTSGKELNPSPPNPSPPNPSLCPIRALIE